MTIIHRFRCQVCRKIKEVEYNIVGGINTPSVVTPDGWLYLTDHGYYCPEHPVVVTYSNGKIMSITSGYQDKI